MKDLAEEKKAAIERVAPSNIERVSRDPLGRIEIRIRGRAEPICDVRVARCFPWSLPDRYISLLAQDGKEIALLDSLDCLDPWSRCVIEEELHDKVFSPKLLRVVEHKREFGVTSITADTDRGRVTFQIRSRDDIRMLSPWRGLFRDADGTTYEVADIRALDPASRRCLEQYF